MSSLESLGLNRNTSLVGTCEPVTTATRLSCPLSGDRLLINDDVRLEWIVIRIRTCNSSLSPKFSFSNETTYTPSDLRCDTMISLEQLELLFDVTVFLNQNNNTVIRVGVSFC